MKQESGASKYGWRHWLVVLVLLIAACVVIGRMVQLMVIERAFLLGQGDARAIRVVSIPAYRGMITDRNGEPLAISSPVESVWANPKQVDLSDERLPSLAKLLNIPLHKMKAKLKANKNKEFIYFKRGLNPSFAKRVKVLDIPGVALQREYRRYYPEGEVTAHIVGFTNIDDRGQEGLELAYNQWLRGIPGKKKVVKDRLGHVVEDLNLIREPKPGHDLVLSIDRRIQYLAYRELAKAVKKFKAKSGSVVVLDVKTGEILAVANQPSYNPNRRPADTHGRYRNRAVTDVFEPGSTIKAFSVANALASGKYFPDTEVDTSPGWIRLKGGTVRDEHNLGIINVTTILQKSSNVGVTKLTLSLPPTSLPKLLHKIGFGERTMSGFPGESSGRLPVRRVWKPFTLATLSFGYGIAVTTLQLAHAYATLANDGVKLPLTFLRREKVPSGQRVLSAKVSREILLMLESVIERGGTATRAQVPGYRVTGKTGTVRIAGPNGYERNHHIGIFVGAAPVSNPRLVVAVDIYDPKGWAYYGGLVAAPVFSKVMGGALRILDIAPDHLPELKMKHR